MSVWPVPVREPISNPSTVRLGTSLCVSMSSVERCTRITSASLTVRVWLDACPNSSMAVTKATLRRLISIYCNNLIECPLTKCLRWRVPMKRLVVLTGLCLTVSFLKAQDEPAPAPAPQEETPAAAPGGRGGAPGGRGGATNEPRPYDRVITKDAKTSEGVFKVHLVRDRGTDRYYYEIPPSEMGKDFLFVTQIAKNTLGAGYGGQTVGEMVGRWERRENRVLLREMSYDLIADPSEPIAKAVQAANNPSIVMAFNIEAFGPGDSAVIEVTRLFLSD